jgi:hypothetical protein
VITTLRLEGDRDCQPHRHIHISAQRVAILRYNDTDVDPLEGHPFDAAATSHVTELKLATDPLRDAGRLAVTLKPCGAARRDDP